MDRSWLDVVMLVAGVAGVALMVVSTVTDVSIMVGILLCGVAAAAMVARSSQQASSPTDD